MLPRTKVFVGSLPPGSKPEELRRLFENFGIVTECDIMNRCGFVHMQTQDMAESAIKALHNTTFKGATISVERGRMKERGTKGKGGSQGRGQGGMSGGRPGGFRGGDRGDMKGRTDRGGDRGMNFGNGGPIRRDRQGGGMRAGPYQRDRPDFNRRGGKPNMRNGMDRFDRDGPLPPLDTGRGGMMDRGLPGMMDRGGMGGSNMMDRYDDGYGFSNEDRRGFALPERQMYPNDNVQGGNMYDDRRGGPIGGLDDRRSGPPIRGGNPSFDRRPLGGDRNGMNNGPSGDMFTRRSGGPMGGGMGGGNRGSGGYDRNDRMDNYNQSFPPLGGGGGMNNRNGPPPRRDMMPNRRF